jgi:zinc transporter, ZIP family
MHPAILIILVSMIGPVFGSLIGVLAKPSEKLLFIFLSFTAGVMLAISFIQLIPQSAKIASLPITILGFGLGAFVMYVMDKLLPHIHPHLNTQEPGAHLKKTAVFLLTGIFLHNFPEGLAMGIGSVTEFKISLLIAISLTIHDIPEGIATAAPYYFTSKKRLKSFLLSVSTGLPTIAGFLISYFLFPSIPHPIIGLLIAATAGLMVYISVDELIPTSCFNSNDHWVIFSFILGVLMVMSLGML